MNNRRKNEGEEELQVKLLEVTEDPTFGHKPIQSNKAPVMMRKLNIETKNKNCSGGKKILH